MTYRQLVAREIASRPDIYTKDYLEKDPSEYTQWITNPDKWGGEIEISILSNLLQVQIAVMDIRSNHILVYGDDALISSSSSGNSSGRSSRIYLLYDGVHYDAMVKTTTTSPMEQKVFHPVEDLSFHSLAQEYLKELSQQKKFVNLQSGLLQCNICLQTFHGQQDAIQHAKSTGHQNFGQT